MLIDAGAQVTISSDWDADELSPYVKLATILGRSSNTLSAEAILRMMTVEPSIYLGIDSIAGTLEVGKAADLVILDTDLLTASVSDIRQTQVLATAVNGRPTYNPESLLPQ